MDVKGCQLSHIWRDSHAFDLLLDHALTQLTKLLTHLRKITRNLEKNENNLLFILLRTFKRDREHIFI